MSRWVVKRPRALFLGILYFYVKQLLFIILKFKRTYLFVYFKTFEYLVTFIIYKKKKQFIHIFH